MKKETLLQQIGELKTALNLLKNDLGSEAPDSVALKDFHGVVDGARRNVWAVLKGMNTESYQEYVAGFRVRRAADVLQSVINDIDAGVRPDAEASKALRKTLDPIVNIASVAAGTAKVGGAS